MAKKKMTITEKRIRKNDKNRYISIIQGTILLLISILLLFCTYFKTYLQVNMGLVNGILLYILDKFNVLFGSMSILIIFTALIFSFIIMFEKSIKVYKYICFLLSYICLAVFFTLKNFNLDVNQDAGQRLLEYGFSKNGAGVFGSVFSIPFYSFKEFSYVFLLLAIIFILICFAELLKLIYETISHTYAYYNSEEYRNKKQILQAKRKLEQEERRIVQKTKEDKIKNVIITLSKDSFDKQISKKPKDSIFSKTEYYSKEELEQRQKSWNQYVQDLSEQKVKEDKIKREQELEEELRQFHAPKESLENIKEENKAILEPEIKIENEKMKYSNSEKIIEFEKEEIQQSEGQKALEQDLKKSIDEIFTYKQVDAAEKEKMLKEINENISKLERVLKEFGVEAKVVDYATGPTITRYEITIPSGVRVNKVTQLSDEISMYLSAESVRFEAPIPGKSTIGIETPNKIKEKVYFSNLLHNKDLEKGDLKVILGKDIVGRDKIIDIAKMPHLLIAGQTGSGKSVAINTIISTLISKKSEDEVKFILIDPKMVELMPYNGIPHLLVPVIIDPEQAAIALKWAVAEMEERYKKLAQINLRNIKSYNQLVKNDKMPYIVVIIDELADLMMVSANSVEISIARIAQKARAVGIHLIVATQRPSTDVITGMIKANLPSRISFALRSQIDSRTILDQMGAEKLLGMGDMLLLENGSSKLDRIQGAYISDEEVASLTAVLKSKKKANYNMDILTPTQDAQNQDPYYSKALELVDRAEDKVSISYLQRELQIGFNRASRICKELRENGVIDENNQKIVY